LFGLFGAGEWAESVGGLMTVKISSLAATLPFLLMLVVLLVKPSGLKGEQA
jgi:branched-chain amino acid transport system permease protein